MKRVLLLLCLFLASQFSLLAFPNYDTTYVEGFGRKWGIRTFIATRTLDFSFKPVSSIDSIRNMELRYVPNVAASIGFGVFYKNTSLNISVRLPRSEEDVFKRGNTSYQDYRVNLINRRFGGNAYYTRYEGFYLDKPHIIYPDIDPDEPYPFRKDMIMEKMGGELFYIFNEKEFSLNAAYKQTERQVKSAGSMMVLADLSLMNVYADSSLIPESVEMLFSDISGFSSGSFTTFGVLAGYTYSFIIHKWFFVVPSLFTGPGYQWRDLDMGEEDLIDSKLMMKANLRLTTGYNGDKVFTGFMFMMDNNFMPQEQATLRSSLYSMNMFVGMRF